MGFPKRGIAQPGQTPPIVARIDEVIHTSGTGLCACGCDRKLGPKSPSPWFFDEGCQVTWNRRLAATPMPEEAAIVPPSPPPVVCRCIQCIDRPEYIAPVRRSVAARIADLFRRGFVRDPRPDQPHPQIPHLLTAAEAQQAAEARPRLRRMTTVTPGNPPPLTEQEVITGGWLLTPEQMEERRLRMAGLAEALAIPENLVLPDWVMQRMEWAASEASRQLPEGYRAEWDSTPLRFRHAAGHSWGNSADSAHLMHPPANPFRLDRAGNVCSPPRTSAITLVPSTDWGDNTTTVRIQPLDAEGRPAGEPTILVGVDPASIRATYEEPE